MLEPKIQERF